jgi:hypothetical protein
VFDRTHDFIDKGALAYYFNGEDLWYWPDEVMNASSAVTVVDDSDTHNPTGRAISIVGTNSYSLNGADGTGLLYGSQVPATKLRFYVMAKANTSLTWSANFASFSSGTYTALCSISPTLTTSYSVYECDGDATSYSGENVYFTLGAAGTGNTVSIAWIAIRPWFSDLEVNGPVNATSYQVSGSPFGTANLADWTDSGAANGSVPVWNSTTSRWTPGSSIDQQTCNASLVANYARALCVYTITSAQILAFDGTYATAVPVITAPGAGRAIVVNSTTESAEYIFNTTPYSSQVVFGGAWGTTGSQALSLSPDISQSSNQVSWPCAGQCGEDNLPAGTIANTAFSVAASAAVTGGNGTIVLTIPYTVYPIQ